MSVPVKEMIPFSKKKKQNERERVIVIRPNLCKKKVPNKYSLKCPASNREEVLDSNK